MCLFLPWDNLAVKAMLLAWSVIWAVASGPQSGNVKLTTLRAAGKAKQLLRTVKVEDESEFAK
jgi:hypothetical protein